MVININELIASKGKKVSDKKLPMKDINRDLTVALLGISLYGKDARDDEIMNIIINNGVAVRQDDRHIKAKERYEERLKNKEFKKVKGILRDTEGFMVMIPR